MTIDLSLLLYYGFYRYCHTPIQFIKALPPQELKHILHQAKLSILPSLLHETFGLTIVESMLCGTPALVANHQELSTTAQRFGGFVFDDLQADLLKILEKYEEYFPHFMQRRDNAISHIRSHSYAKGLIPLYTRI